MLCADRETPGRKGRPGASGGGARTGKGRAAQCVGALWSSRRREGRGPDGRRLRNGR